MLSIVFDIIKVLLCLTDTSLYIYTCVKHFGMANIKKKKYICVFVYDYLCLYIICTDDEGK